MKYQNLFVGFSIGFIIINSTFAASLGGYSGGGGKGVLCKSQVTTLDLFEARRTGLIPLNKSNDLNENLKFFGLEIAKHFSDSLEETSTPQFPEMMFEELQKSIIDKFNNIPTGTHLLETQDATISNLPKDCKIVQIAVYDDKADIIYRDSEYWNMMPVVDQAGLIIHEWIYKRARSYGSINSDETRKVIGQIFSGHNPEPLFAPLWNATNKMECFAGIEGTNHEIFEYFGIEEVQNNRKGIALYFRTFKNITLTSRVSAFIPNLTLDQFLSKKFLSLTTFATQKSMSKEWELEINTGGDNEYFQMRAIDHNLDQLPVFSNTSCQLLN